MPGLQAADSGTEMAGRRQILVFDGFLARIVAVLGDAATLMVYDGLRFRAECRLTLRADGPPMFSLVEVPGPGIEPGTLGFSGLVREWPRPRDPLEKRRGRGATEAHLCQPDAGSGQLDFGFEDPGRPAG